MQKRILLSKIIKGKIFDFFLGFQILIDEFFIFVISGSEMAQKIQREINTLISNHHQGDF